MRVGLAGDIPRRWIHQREPVALLQGDSLAADRDDRLLCSRSLNWRWRRRRPRRASHAARDHGGVAGHAAARVRMPLATIHAVDIVGHGLFAHQDDGAACGQLDGIIGGECARPTAAPGDAGNPVASLVSVFFDVGSKHRVQQLIELLRARRAGRLPSCRSNPLPPFRRRCGPRRARCACRCASAACRACRPAMVNSKSCMSR